VIPRTRVSSTWLNAEDRTLHLLRSIRSTGHLFSDRATRSEGARAGWLHRRTVANGNAWRTLAGGRRSDLSTGRLISLTAMPTIWPVAILLSEAPVKVGLTVASSRARVTLLEVEYVARSRKPTRYGDHRGEFRRPRGLEPANGVFNTIGRS
jgi:hypothetical protein